MPGVRKKKKGESLSKRHLKHIAFNVENSVGECQREKGLSRSFPGGGFEKAVEHFLCACVSMSWNYCWPAAPGDQNGDRIYRTKHELS